MVFFGLCFKRKGRLEFSVNMTHWNERANCFCLLQERFGERVSWFCWVWNVLFIRRLFVFLTSQVQLNHLFKDLSIARLQSTSLTMLHEYQELDPSSPLKVDPMELYSYKMRLKWNWSFLVTLLMFRGTWATQRMHSSPVKTVVYRPARFK